MTLNARMSQQDPRLYSPNRDVAHNFGEIIMEVAKRCEEGNWDTLREYAKEKGLTDEDLGKVCQAVCQFVAKDPEKGESMAVGLSKSGFLDLPPAGRVVVMAYLGVVTLGVHWAGVREATINGVGPAQGYKQLRWHGMRCAKLMTLPRWRRRLYNLQSRVKKAWRALWEKDIYAE